MSPKLSEERIRHKLREISDTAREIQDYFPDDLEDFLKLKVEKHGIYKLTENAIEAVLSVCAVINSDLSLGTPSTEDDLINHLENKEIIDKDLAKSLRDMKGFRNILVHRYGEVNDVKAFHDIKMGLKDFSTFIEEIKRFLQNQKNT